MAWPYCFNVLDSNVPFSKRKLTILKRYIERITSKKHSTVKTVEIGEFKAKESCFCLTVVEPSMDPEYAGERSLVLS